MGPGKEGGWRGQGWGWEVGQIYVNVGGRMGVGEGVKGSIKKNHVFQARKSQQHLVNSS